MLEEGPRCVGQAGTLRDAVEKGDEDYDVTSDDGLRVEPDLTLRQPSLLVLGSVVADGVGQVSQGSREGDQLVGGPCQKKVDLPYANGRQQYVV
jgi:hypothetical protein